MISCPAKLLIFYLFLYKCTNLNELAFELISFSKIEISFTFDQASETLQKQFNYSCRFKKFKCILCLAPSTYFFMVVSFQRLCYLCIALQLYQNEKSLNGERNKVNISRSTSYNCRLYGVYFLENRREMFHTL